MTALSKEENLRRLEVLRRAGMMTEDNYKAKVAELFGLAPTASAPRPPMQATGPEIPQSEAIAPYRFVGLNKVVAKPERKETPLNKPLDDHLCGTLDITFEAETPLLIGQDNKDGVALPLSLTDQTNGPWWIPGSSLRGMIRSAAEILGYGKLNQTNKGYVFPLRDFEHPDYNADRHAKHGRKLGIWSEVKGGWLEYSGQNRENGDPIFQIYEADLHYVEIESLLPLRNSEVTQRSTWIEMTLTDKYSALGMQKGKLFDFTVTRRFRSGFKTKQGQPLVKPDPKGLMSGVVVVSDKSPRVHDTRKQKKLEYVFSPWNKERSPQPVLADGWTRFEQVHTKTGRGDERTAEGSWAKLKPLLQDEKGDYVTGKAIPVFYTGKLAAQDEHFAFGLTRLFKVPHRVNQGEMIAREKAHAETGEDMVEHLFGYVWEGQEEVALKSRLAVSGASITNDQAEVSQGNPLETVMGTPNASFAPYYLEGIARDWSATAYMGAGDTRIAGRKRYLPRDDGNGDMNAALDLIRKRFAQQVNALPPTSRDKEKIKSRMRFLVGKGGKPFRFTARVKLHNVSKAEAGLVLMAACFGGGNAMGNFRHMLGRAKPFGAGQLRLAHYEFKAKGNTGGQPTEADCLQALAHHMQTQGIANYPDTDEVREYLGTCTPKLGHELPGTDGNSPLYLGLKQHADMRKKAGKLDNDVKVEASRTRSLLRAKKWEGSV